MDDTEYRLSTGVLKTKLVVSATVLVLVVVTQVFERSGLVAAFIVAYTLLTWMLWKFSSVAVHWRFLRATPTLLDLAAISMLVWSTGGITSSWFLLYIFPILWVARYGISRSLAVAGLATLGYGVACYTADVGLSAFSPFGFRALVLAAMALTAGFLERTRERTDAKLFTTIAEIDRAVLADRGVTGATRLILEAAMEFTNSDFSAIRLADGLEDAAGRVDQDKQDYGIQAVARILNQQYSSVAASNKPLTLPRKDRAVRLRLGRGSRPDGWTAQLVPLTNGESCLGVLGVFSHRRLQYTHDDARRLSTLGRQIAIAQTNAGLHADSRRSLRMLYEFGERLKSDHSLDRLFGNMLRLVSDQLGSEEAALFLPSGGDPLDLQEGRGPLKKVAVVGPTQFVEERLSSQEELYGGPHSLTRQVFTRKHATRDNSGSLYELRGSDYAAVLPSRVIRHYLAAPLLIRDEVLGVLRVLNKKARDYRPEAGAARLAEHGFSEDDQELLSAIATQVASAIRNARFVEQHAHFKKLVYNSPDPIIVTDGSGRVQNFNRAAEELWGLQEAAVRDTHITTLYATLEHAREIGDEVWAAAERGEGIQDRLALIRKPSEPADEIIPVRLAAAGLLDKAHRRTGSIGIFVDEREPIRRTEERIRNEQLAALGRIAHAKGHDIKHDIGTILTWVDLLKDGAGGNGETLEACSAIETATMRAISKLQDMLMAADPKPPKMEITSLRTMLATFESDILREANATKVDFRLRYPRGDHLLLADAEQMLQLFTNLFGNSLDAIKGARELYPNRPTGTIAVDVMTGQDHVLLSWTDDGSGMSEDVRAKAFLPLFTTKKTGSGLGLFIARTIVENHGGRIEAEPVHEGGVRFTIQFPFTRAVGAADLAARGLDTSGGSGQ